MAVLSGAFIGAVLGAVSGALWGYLGNDYEAADSALGTGLLGIPLGGLAGMVISVLVTYARSKR